MINMPKVAELRSIVGQCMEQREDGRWYPTHAGCLRLQEWLNDRGFNCAVKIGDNRKFEIIFNTPKVVL